VVSANKFEASLLRRWIASACLLLVLVFSGLEASHAHSDLRKSSSIPCVVCVSAQAQAPTLAMDALPVLLAVATLAIPDQVQASSLADRLELFIRPPPASDR